MPARSLYLLLCAFLLFKSCAPTHASITCYTNFVKGNEMNLLGNHGRRGIFLIDCPDKTECFEALAKPVFGLDGAMYSSGCGNCPKWHYPLDCKKCSWSKCNRDIVKSIWTTHRECFVANDETVMGKRRAYCTKGIESCYWIEVRDDYNVIRYTANCGTGWPGCTTCKENLCNAPADVKKRVQDEVRVIEEEDAKEDAPVLPSEQVARNIKKINDAKDNGGSGGKSGGEGSSGSGGSSVSVGSGSSGDSIGAGSDSGRGSDKISGSGGVGNTGGGSSGVGNTGGGSSGVGNTGGGSSGIGNTGGGSSGIGNTGGGSSGVENTGGGSGGVENAGGGSSGSGNSITSPSSENKKINDGNNDKRQRNRGDSNAADKESDKEGDGKSGQNGSENGGANQRKLKGKDGGKNEDVKGTNGGKKIGVELEGADIDNSGSRLYDATVGIFMPITCTLVTFQLR